MPINSLPPWPPSLPEDQLIHLQRLSTLYSLSHSFCHLPPNSPDPPTQTYAAPLSLFPSPFPRHLFENACELQTVYNALYARIALDWNFLDKVMEKVVKVDMFQAELWYGWKRIRDELVQPLQLGIFRSDYLLHSLSSLDPLSIKQVEFNTIASSFGGLSQKACELHKYLAEETDDFFHSSPHLADPDNYPTNDSLVQIASGLAAAYKAYNRGGTVILFVVQEGERNIFDQLAIQYELQSKYGIKSVRHTFSELADLAQIDRDLKHLLLPNPLMPHEDPVEVSVIYFRAGYTPKDYPTHIEWATRSMLERSRAIKCPSMALQLAGCKKVQQVLTEPGMLEEFLLGDDRPDVGFGLNGRNLTYEDVKKIRKTWIGLWPLDYTTPLGKEGYKLATTQSSRFVMKPQREGGGNNIYKTDIPLKIKIIEKGQKDKQLRQAQRKREKQAYADNAFDDSEESEEGEEGDEVDSVEAYILMEMINPPEGIENYLLKGGADEPRRTEIVSELGIYGVCLFGDSQKYQVINREAGFLLRTKGRDSDEGGVAIGES